MALPAKVIMDRLHELRSLLASYEEYEQAGMLDTLIETANRAGHEVYTWEGCAERVSQHVSRLDGLSPEVVALVHDQLRLP